MPCASRVLRAESLHDSWELRRAEIVLGAAGPISSMHRSPVSSLQQAPLHRFGVTRTHRRSLGRVGRVPTSSERSSYSHQKYCESRRRAARGDIISSYNFSCRRVFLSFLFSWLVG